MQLRARWRSPPEAYWKAVDGASIGPRVGSCGTAMYRREPVIVTDIYKQHIKDLLMCGIIYSVLVAED
jgi:hypothetical protein